MAGAAKRHYSTGSIKSGSFRSLAKKIACIGASRTDAGVHALGNVAVFDTDARMPADRIAFALNTRLPADIRIQGSSEVPPDFHPRFFNRNSLKRMNIGF